MIIPLNDIMKADIIQLEDYDMQLAFEIETVERQLQYADKKNDRVWHEKALKARDHMKRTRALIKTRLDKLYYGEERLLHGVILKMIRRDMSIDRFMEYVNKAKIEAGFRGGK
ncbi:hypothetical protein KGB39_gp33 [Salmonella phage Skate]|uniref:Uncharacterized protein n=1 Tax=Salmonella phage Skate TaxID=2234035 RepID=A0A2Z5HS29_9CAUD|nr:hypothetical protein KGB39_gp33 [Salmonella phage Skate]AXC42991.1 hypothetical protein CPT_Skate_033 [Salmonella phage Skate]EKY7761637.1 hypothetical protein [Salmonella enterica]